MHSIMALLKKRKHNLISDHEQAHTTNATPDPLKTQHAYIPYGRVSSEVTKYFCLESRPSDRDLSQSGRGGAHGARFNSRADRFNGRADHH